MATGARKGMNFDEVSTWGNRIKNQDAEQLRNLVTGFCKQAEALDWSGTDFENFVSNEVGAVHASAAKLAEALVAMGDCAARNAQAQQQTSQVG